MPCSGEKYIIEEGEEEKKECEEVAKGRQKKAKWDGKEWERETERLSEKGSLPSFDGPDRKQGPGFISSVCHCGDSCSHQHQPRGIQSSTREK